MTFTLTEDQVALRLGVAKEWLRDRRGPQGVNWNKGQHGQVLWDPERVQALMDLELAKSGQPAAPAPATQAVFEVTVRRTNFPNKRVLEATDAQGAIKVVVGLWANRFHPGQKITVQHHPTNPVLLYVPPISQRRQPVAQSDAGTAAAHPQHTDASAGGAGSDPAPDASAQPVSEPGLDGVRGEPIPDRGPDEAVASV